MKKLLSIILLFGGLHATAQTKVKNDTEYRAVKLKTKDAQFLAFKDTAQKHIHQFIDAVNKKSSGYYFLVKSDFVEKGTHEHMWSQIKEYSNGSFMGVFIDSPFEIKNIKRGDKVVISKKEVEDWVIYNLKNEKIAGGFSDKYLKSQK